MHKMIFILFLIALCGNVSLAQTTQKDSISNVGIIRIVCGRGFKAPLNELSDPILILYNYDDLFVTTKRNALILDGNVQSGSNYLPSGLAYQLYHGGEIDESLRLSTLNPNHYSNLRAGGITNLQIKFFSGLLSESYYNRRKTGRFHKLKSIPSKGEFIAGQSNIVNALLQPNIAALYFLGNGVFVNQTTKLGPSDFEFLEMNYIGFNQNFNCIKYGKDPEVPNAKFLFCYHLGFQLNQLQNYQSISIENGSIFTAPYGQYLDLKYNLRIKNNQNQHPIGLGLNFGIIKNIKKVTVSASAQNVGFWKVNRMSTLSADTSFRYQGIVLQTWGQNPQLPNDSLKSILGLHSTTTHERIWLPGVVKLQVRYGNTWRMDMSYYYTLHALPLLEWKYIKWSNLYRKQFRYSVIPNIGYGGFGTYHVGVLSGVQYKNASLLLNISDLQSLALKNQSSFSAGIKLAYSF